MCGVGGHAHQDLYVEVKSVVTLGTLVSTMFELLEFTTQNCSGSFNLRLKVGTTMPSPFKTLFDLFHNYTIFTGEVEVPAGYQGGLEYQTPTTFTPLSALF